ncbi:MAG: bifunctional nuclease family protein [Candidatus Coatesbacteria bacterium]
MGMNGAVEMKVEGVRSVVRAFEQDSQAVILSAAGGETTLAIWVGEKEAECIQLALEGKPHPGGLTEPHALLANTIALMNGVVRRAEITAMWDFNFYAAIVVEQDGQERVIEARPSDAIVIAASSRVPIRVAPDVLKEAGIGKGDGRDLVAGASKGDLLRLAYGWLSLGRTDDAVAAGERLLELEPTQLYVTDELAKTYAGMGSLHRAWGVYERGIRACLDRGNGQWAAVLARGLAALAPQELKKKPPVHVSAPRVIDDFGEVSANGWWAWGGSSEGGSVPAPAGRAGRAYRFAFEYAENPWPWFYLEFGPNQIWDAAQAIAFAVHLGEDPARKEPVRMILDIPFWNKTASSFQTPVVELKPGWNEFRWPFADPTWGWKEHRRGDLVERVPFPLPSKEAIRGVTFFFPGEGRKGRVTVHIANVRLE